MFYGVLSDVHLVNMWYSMMYLEMCIFVKVLSLSYFSLSKHVLWCI